MIGQNLNNEDNESEENCKNRHKSIVFYMIKRTPLNTPAMVQAKLGVISGRVHYPENLYTVKWSDLEKREFIKHLGVIIVCHKLKITNEQCKDETILPKTKLQKNQI